MQAADKKLGMINIRSEDDMTPKGVLDAMTPDEAAQVCAHAPMLPPCRLPPCCLARTHLFEDRVAHPLCSSCCGSTKKLYSRGNKAGRKEVSEDGCRSLCNIMTSIFTTDQPALSHGASWPFSAFM